MLRLAIVLSMLHLAPSLFAQMQMRGRPGIEVNTNFNVHRRDNVDFGANFLFTSAFGIHKDEDVYVRIFGADFGIFQFGPSLTFNPVRAEDGRTWRMGVALTYNQIAPEQVVGFSFRGKALTVLNGDKKVFDNWGFKGEVGLSCFGVVTVYYGRTFAIRDYAAYPYREHSITLAFNLNTSILAFGLQGM